MDECTDGTHNCDDPTRAFCINTDGSYTCECKEEFTGDGTHCVMVCSQICLSSLNLASNSICFKKIIIISRHKIARNIVYLLASVFCKYYIVDRFWTKGSQHACKKNIYLAALYFYFSTQRQHSPDNIPIIITHACMS